MVSLSRRHNKSMPQIIDTDRDVPRNLKNKTVIGVDRVNATSLGTGTSEILLGGAALKLPDWAKSILGIIPVANIDVPTVSESVIPKLTLKSDDFNIGPYEVLAAPISSCLGATVAPFIGKPEFYPVNCPVDGGNLSIYGTALVANTAAPIMSCSVVLSNQPPTAPQEFSKMGTLTDSGVTAETEVAGTSYNFSKSQRIMELFGTLLPDTVAAADAMSGYIRYSSNEFVSVTPSKLELSPIPGGLSDMFSTKVNGVSRNSYINIPTHPGQVNIQDYLYLDKAPAATGKWVSGVRYQ